MERTGPDGRPVRTGACRAGRPVGAVLAALLLVAGPAAGQVPDREVVELSFRGNDTYESEELATAITTKQTTCSSLIFQIFPFCPLTNWGFAHDRAYLDEANLPADLVRLQIFYRRRGFRSVNIDTAVTRTDDATRIAFRIEEGPPTRVQRLDISGAEGVLDPARARDLFPIQVGDRLDLVAVDRGEERIAELLRNRGYAEATVLREYFIPSGSRQAELSLEVRPGPRIRVREIRVEGEGRLGEGLVRRSLTLRPGEYLRRNQVLESQRTLFQVGSVRFANIRTVDVAGTDTLRDVVVDVTPAPTRSLRTGVGVTTTDCFQTEARFTHRSLFGGARRLRLTGRLSNLAADRLQGSFPCSAVGEDEVFRELDFALRADLQFPYFFSSRNSFQTGLFWERETVPDIFVRDSRGGELSVTRHLRARMPVSLTWRPELTGFDEESADIFFCVNFGFCQPEDIQVLTQSQWLSPLTLRWNYDRTNAPFSPTSGYYVNMTLEGAGVSTGSDYQYVRFNVDAADFEPVAPGLVLGVRFRTGFVEAVGRQPFRRVRPGETVIHPRKRFFAGGPQSVRGFEQNLLGPTVLVLESRDCRGRGVFDGGFEPTREDLVTCARDVAAADTASPGSVFEERPAGGDAAFEANFELRARLSDQFTVVGFMDVGQVWVDISELESPVVSPGVGLRFSSPVGPLRLDIGYDPTDAASIPVVAELPNGEILDLEESVLFDPVSFDDPGPLTEFRRRLQIHVSIGEAF